MRRKSIIFLLSVVLASALIGCNGAKNPGYPDSVSEGAEKEMINVTDLTEMEKELLVGAYPNDEERIQNGSLFDHQDDALKQLRAGIAYLTEKYPEKTPDIILFSPATKFTQWAEMSLEAPSGKMYRLAVSPTENGYECADDYYNEFLREPYDQYVADILAKAGFTVLSFTEFPSLVGTEVDGNTSIEALIAIEPPLTRNTHLFIAQSIGDPIAAEIESRIKEIGLYGSYTLYFAASLDEEVMALEENRKTMEYKSFSCFE